MKDTYGRYLTLGLALTYLGKTNKTWKDLLRKIHTVVIWLWD